MSHFILDQVIYYYFAFIARYRVELFDEHPFGVNRVADIELVSRWLSIRTSKPTSQPIAQAYILVTLLRNEDLEWKHRAGVNTVRFNYIKTPSKVWFDFLLADLYRSIACCFGQT